MAGATILPVPKAVDLEAHHYPRMWKRNLFFLYGGMFLTMFQLQRYAALCKQSTLRAGEYMDWGSHNAPKRVRF